MKPLYEELWHWAKARKPELPSVERRALLDMLIDPILADETDGFSKAVLIGSLFQLLLLSYLVEELV